MSSGHWDLKPFLSVSLLKGILSLFNMPYKLIRDYFVLTKLQQELPKTKAKTLLNNTLPLKIIKWLFIVFDGSNYEGIQIQADIY